jgi:hypothetical protein
MKLAWLRFACSLCVAACGLAPVPVAAQDLEPRAYANTPAGMNFLVAGLAYTTGDVVTDAALALEHSRIDALLPVAAYARALDLGGRSGKFDLIVPYGCADGSTDFRGQPVERDVCGFGDPSMKLSINLYGAPTLRLAELPAYRQDLIVGVGLRIGTPLGQHDGDKLLNIGANRWSFRPEIGVSKAMGRFTLEMIAGAAVFTDNDDYFGHRDREQDPIYSLQGHLIYTLRAGAWMALNATAYEGGRTTIDGVRGDDTQRNTRIGATLTWPLGRRSSLKFAASTGATTRRGGDFDTVAVAWQYRWGAGL